MERNSFAQNVRRRQLEADFEVAKAKGNLREIKLYAQVGFTGTDNEFNSAYRRLKDNQILEVGFKIPILAWGFCCGLVLFVFCFCFVFVCK